MKTEIVLHPHLEFETLRSFLLEAEQDRDHRWIRAEMEHILRPETMIAAFDNTRLTGLLHMEQRQLVLEKKRALAFEIEKIWVHPQADAETVQALLEAAKASADASGLFVQGFLEESQAKACGFQKQLELYEYSLKASSISRGDTSHVRSWEKDQDLYDLYTAFIAHFPGSLVYTRLEWQRLLTFARAAGYKGVIAENDKGRKEGFILYKTIRRKVEAVLVLYLNGKALRSMLMDLLYTHMEASFVLSQWEQIQALIPDAIFMKSWSVYASMPHPGLFSRWLSGSPATDLPETYWNQHIWSHLPL